jgi:hypothetical protein
MSYEGYSEAICKNGHRYQFGDYNESDEEDNKLCPHCGAGIAFENMVDCTNVNDEGKFSEEGWKSLLISDEVKRTCDMGHEHIVNSAVYRIPPSSEWMERFRQYSKE